MSDESPAIAVKPRRLSPTWIAAIFFVLFDSFVLYAAYIHKKVESMPMTYTGIKPLPDFEWKDFDGKSHNIKDLAGHVVVLHFWASWCPPCREEFPKLWQAAAADKDIIFLTISSDDAVEKSKQFIKVTPDVSNLSVTPNVLYAWDPARLITYEIFMSVRYPETIVIDPHMNMRRKYPGPVDWMSPEIQNYLKELKAEK